MSIVENLITRILQQATIVHKSALSPKVYHITIQSENIKKADFVPGYFLRIGVGIGIEDLSFRDKLRSYSVWRIDKEKGTIDLAVATHSKGPGAAWALSCNVGDTVHFAWHKGKFLTDSSSDDYLFIGDISALAHLYEIRRSLPKNKHIQSIIYCENIGELFADIDGKTPFDFYEMPENPAALLNQKLAALLPAMKGNKMVYIGGDSRICVSLTNFFRRELNWGSKQIKTKPFWNPDKKGLE